MRDSSKPDPSIRPLLQSEIPELAAAVSDTTTLAQVEMRWREQELGFRRILVAEVDNRIVGTVSTHRPETPPNSMHLFALDVGAEWRNRGIGRALVEYVVEDARRSGLRSVHLEVRVDNPARRLYHRIGFRRVGQHFANGWWRYLEDGERERVVEESLRMVRRLRPSRRNEPVSRRGGW